MTIMADKQVKDNMIEILEMGWKDDDMSGNPNHVIHHMNYYICLVPALNDVPS